MRKCFQLIQGAGYPLGYAAGRRGILLMNVSDDCDEIRGGLRRPMNLHLRLKDFLDLDHYLIVLHKLPTIQLRKPLLDFSLEP
jgi:hypothetical protein